MKRRRADIHGAMNIGRPGKTDLAKLPGPFDRIAAERFYAEIHIAEANHDVVVTVRMPKRRIACGHRHVKDAHKFIFKLGMMPRLSAELHRVLWRVRLRPDRDGN